LQRSGREGSPRATFLVVDAFKRPSEGLAFRRASASVRPSRIAAEPSRTSRKSIRSSQLRLSVQSSHRRY
jgi:hypothetical protein